MRSLPKLLLLLLFLVPSPTYAQWIECRRDLSDARDLIEERSSFFIQEPEAHDIEGAYRRLEPEARRAKTPEECADVLTRFMAALHDGHSKLVFYPELAYSRPKLVIGSQRERTSRVAGAEPAIHPYVLARDTADRVLSTILPGSEIVEVNGVPVEKLYTRLHQRAAGSTQQWKDYRSDEVLLEGAPGSPLVLAYRSPGGRENTITLMRPAFDEAEAWWKERGEREGSTESGLVEEGWGYIKLGTFHDDDVEQTVAAFDEALDPLLDAPGLIIDLRGNGGGYIDAATQIAGRFLTEERTLGFFNTREPGKKKFPEVRDEITGNATTQPRLLAKPRKETYRGQLVILIDQRCFAACESFAGGMQELGRALVMGTSASGGGSGLAEGLELHSGAVISFSSTVAWLPSGQQIDGHGVAPDVRLRLRPQDMYSGRDRVLERAIKALAEGEAPRISETQAET